MHTSPPPPHLVAQWPHPERSLDSVGGCARRLDLGRSSRANLCLKKLTQGDVLESSLPPDQVQVYGVDLVEGGLLFLDIQQLGADVMVAARSPNGDVVAHSKGNAHSRGWEHLRLESRESGPYRIELTGDRKNLPSARYRLIVRHLLSRVAAENYRTRDSQLEEAAVSWIRNQAIPLETLDPDADLLDLAPLKRIVGNARVVGLGEATHGTRDSSLLKRRMMRFLAEEMGFTVFAFEARMAEAYDIDRFVLTGEGDPAVSLHDLDWINTEEMLDLIHWMRRYNANSSNLKKLRFFGVDVDHPSRPAAGVLDYLARVDPAYYSTARERLLEVADAFTFKHFERRPQESHARVIQFLEGISRRVDERKAAYVEQSTAADWALARLNVRLARQGLLFGAEGENVREPAMAENMQWILEQEGPDAKAVLWAHDFHVAFEEGWLGSYLRHSMGDRYRSIGFVSNRGRFRAFDKTKGRPSDIAVGPNPLGSVFARAGHQRALIDFRELPDGSPAVEWFAAPRAARYNGGIYPDESMEFRLGVMPQRHDALLFVEEVDAARLRWLPPGPDPIDIPSNLGFEDGELGAAPPGWEVRRKSKFQVVTREASPPGAGRWAVITSARSPGSSFGGLRQRIRAQNFRGRTVTVQARIRAAVSGDLNRVHFYVRVRGGSQPFFEYRSIEGEQWESYEIAAAVSETSKVIEYGVVLVGEGSAWVNYLSID